MCMDTLTHLQLAKGYLKEVKIKKEYFSCLDHSLLVLRRITPQYGLLIAGKTIYLKNYILDAIGIISM